MTPKEKRGRKEERESASRERGAVEVCAAQRRVVKRTSVRMAPCRMRNGGGLAVSPST